MMVGDEETGGAWGTGWLLEQRPELAGEACMIGEPESPDGLRVGEKGKAQFRLVAEDAPRHGGLGTGDDVVVEVGGRAPGGPDSIVEMPDNPPEDLLPVLETMTRYWRTEHDRGRQWLYRRPSMAAGVIRGGIKVNVVPRRCEVEVDCRLPFGITPDDIRPGSRGSPGPRGTPARAVRVDAARLQRRATRRPTRRWWAWPGRTPRLPPGREPALTMTFAATDARYFRPRGVPTLIFGPRPNNMAAPDEFITVDDLVAVAKVHLATALDVLHDDSARPR